MYLCVFEDDRINHLLPLVHTKAVYDLRVGMRTLLETACEAFPWATVVLHARPTVAEVTARTHGLPVNRLPNGADVLFVNGRYIAQEGPLLEMLRQAPALEESRVWMQEGHLLAAWIRNVSDSLLQSEEVAEASFRGVAREEVSSALFVHRLWDLPVRVEQILRSEFQARMKALQPAERAIASAHPVAQVIEPEQVFIEPGVRILPGVILNAEEGPIYIGREATIQEQAVIRGPAFIGARSTVKIGARIQGSAIGPVCKVGGEVCHSIMEAWSNKAHDGFLGHAYLGRWCNIGAGTDNSNLKNDYGPVSLYNEALGMYENTGEQFVGLIMGDHSKCGIHTMFNTGTVVGVFCNVFGGGYQPRYLPSFSWGGAQDGFSDYRLEKALRVAAAVMARRSIVLTEAERDLLTHVFKTTRAEPVEEEGLLFEESLAG